MTTKILVLPGMGDIYWVFVKLQSFLKYHNIEKPEVYTWELQASKANRSADYIKRVPFVTYGGSWSHQHFYITDKQQFDETSKVFNDIYMGTKSIIPNFQGFDYVISCNGILRNGFDLNAFELGQYESNWYFDLTESQVQNKTREQYKNDKYIVAYFTDDGMYLHTWLKCLSVKNIFECLEKIHNETGYKIYLTGGKWDTTVARSLQAFDNTFIHNLVGQTSIDQLFGLIQSSQGMIGWCGGNTIMSTYFKKPTLIIWSTYFRNEQFYKYCVPPDSLNRWYKYKVVERTNSNDLAQTMISLCGA